MSHQNTSNRSDKTMIQTGRNIVWTITNNILKYSLDCHQQHTKFLGSSE